MTVAFVFPGQGSQTVGMGKALADNFAVARAVFDEVDDALSSKLSAIVFEGPIETLTLTENAQPALMAVSLAAFRVLQAEAGFDLARDAQFVAGHSLGEYSALAAAGTFSIADTARTLSQYNSAIEIRSKANETVNELAAWSAVPVINGMDHDRHPCQSMSDALTILESAGTLAGVTFAYVGDAAHPCNSLSTTLTKLGLNVRVGNAAGYEMAPELQELAAKFAAESGGSFLLTNDPLEAIAGADFIYTDCWWWTGQEDEYKDRIDAFKAFQVNPELWSHAKPETKFMHCLPAMRGEEVVDEIADGPMSLIFPQAQNRMHFQKALMLAVIGIDELPADADLQPIGKALLS